MRHSGRFLRPVVKQPGGQSKTARWIIGHMVEAAVYCEPFAGGLSVLLNRPRVAREVVGDLDGDLMGLYGVLRDRGLMEQFCGAIRDIGYDGGVFGRVRRLWAGDPQDVMVRAVLFYCLRRMSRNGEGVGFSWTGNGRLRGGRHGDVNAWECAKPLVREVGARLRGLPGIPGVAGVELVQGDAVGVMRSCEGLDAVVYCDPPWPYDCRASRGLYGEFEMSLADHVVLLDYLVGSSFRGCYVSVGPSELYRSVLGGAGWDRAVRYVSNNMSTGSGRGKKESWLYFRH